MRRELRAKRRALPAPARALADRAIRANIRRLPEFQRARSVAVFLAFDGEPSLAPLLDTARRRGKRLYAPVLDGLTMTFRELVSSRALTTNFFGILEPELGSAIDARELDLVLTPLVAFDDRGVRIGVGRGYYDRCFRFLRARTRWRRPKLFGVAYELQRVAEIGSHAWDVPLFGAVTETGVRRF
ncbi:MAG TPA: 5-formyltetrahydrofolate cyclo-ligase [Gammaproteobacteria bacterium]|nr:5-formyltetrahydrofolate cyclo-ligase [Gammaproteobacteria bacterium]